MTGKYRPLTDYLCAAAHSGRHVVEMTFDEIAELVGGLPHSVSQRQWWANTDHSQAKAWAVAGYRVEQVYLDGRRVRFVPCDLTAVVHVTQPVHSTATRPSVGPSEPAQVGSPVDVRVVLSWQNAGAVVVGGSACCRFPVWGRFRACIG